MSYLKYPGLSKEQLQTYETLSILENSAQHHANLRAAENAALEKQKRDAENEKLMAKHRAEREAELKAEAEARRKEAASNFEADLKRKFFEGNSFASESDFQAMLPELRKRAMLENTDMADKSEAAMRASGNYVPM
jgi:membrane protein involved in colicin uptake